MSNAKSTVREELQVGRANTPDFAWPTVTLALVLLVVFAASVASAMLGYMPYWAAALVNTAVIYSIYTVMHEAVHYNISSRRHGLRWVDAVLGQASGFLLWQFVDHHRAQHMVHHTHANEDDDPDINARGSFPGYLFVRLPVALVNYFNPFALYAECREYGVSKSGTRRSLIGFAVNATVLVGLIAAGFGYEVLTLWFIPWWIGNSAMLTMFTWLPHHDHYETGRYRDTRIFDFPGANFLLLGQGYHLIHHMMPAVPWYRYKPTFLRLRPVLEEHDARIEGLIPQPQNRAPAPDAEA